MTQFCKALLDTTFDNIFKMNHSEHLVPVRYHKWRPSAFGNSFHRAFDKLREATAILFDVSLHGFCRALANMAAVRQIHAAHPCLSREGNEGGAKRFHIPFTYIEFVLG